MRLTYTRAQTIPLDVYITTLKYKWKKERKKKKKNIDIHNTF